MPAPTPFFGAAQMALQALQALVGGALKTPVISPFTAAIAAAAHFSLRIGEHVLAIFCAEPVKHGVQTLSNDWGHADPSKLVAAILAAAVLLLLAPRLISFWKALAQRLPPPPPPSAAKRLALILGAAAAVGLGLLWVSKRRRRA